MANEIIIIQRDVDGFLIPSGARIFLQQGTEVMILQALGDSFTVNVYGNLVRIEGSDADALGRELVAADVLPEGATVEDQVWTKLKTCYDPEIPVNIVDLGLIYSCEIEKQGAEQHKVRIRMTLTAPGCGMGPVLMEDVRRKVLLVPTVAEADVEMVFDPPWDREMMSEAAKLQLGLL